jgi:cytochrome c
MMLRIVQLLALLAVATAKTALILTETGGFRHAIIDSAYAALSAEMAARGDWTLTRTDQSAGFFTPAVLATFDVVVFFFTSGDGNNGPLQGTGAVTEKAAFQAYINGGGGFAGIHAAAGTYQTAWPWYNQLLGAVEGKVATVQTATVRVEDHSHQSTRHLPYRWQVFDEWYNFDYIYNPMRQTVQVLICLSFPSSSCLFLFTHHFLSIHPIHRLRCGF